ncbi:MAG: ROK family transcriptional regulator [Treponema sp.]|jgi:predicted NBD/HSP70 family sugar kinase|nr:ROK family transcriptional regulator [Treponema sp.]
MDKLQIAQINKYNVLRCLIRKGPINRAAIAKLTDLSIPTVMSIVDDLFEKNVVRSIGKGISSGGKPPEMLEIVPDRFYYIGVDVGRTAIRVVVNNVVYEQVSSFQEATGNILPAKDLVDRICSYIITIIDQSAIESRSILGVGVAMPGLIENDTGRVLFSPDFSWEDIPLKTWLQNSLQYLILVENSNRALALNESYLPGEVESSRTTFSINLGYGIGAGLVMGDQIFTGSNGTSGEIGHITVIRDGPLCACGNRGCLEAVASGMAIATQAKKEAEQNKKTKILELCEGDLSRIDAKLVFEAVEQGDKAALTIIDTAAEYIGIGIAMAVNVLDPDRIILCGGLMKSGPYFFEKINASIQKHKMWKAGDRHLVISTGTKGEFSTANGACRVLANSLWWQRALPI